MKHFQIVQFHLIKLPRCIVSVIRANDVAGFAAAAAKCPNFLYSAVTIYLNLKSPLFERNQNRRTQYDGETRAAITPGFVERLEKQ